MKITSKISEYLFINCAQLSCIAKRQLIKKNKTIVFPISELARKYSINSALCILHSALFP